MPFMPLAVLPMLMLGFLSLALVAGGGAIIYEWWRGAAISTVVLSLAIAMLVIAALGRFIVLAFHRRGNDEPSWARAGAITRVERPDGTILYVEMSGPPDASPVVLVHGWGVDNRSFYYAKRALRENYRVIAWDLRGLGQSSRAGSDGYTLDAMADDLAAIVELAGAPAVVIGHSIGGMIAQTFARRHARLVGSAVTAVVLVGTTYTDPTRTMLGARVMHALERPLFMPLMHLTIALAPLVWAMNWLSYINGTQLIATGMTGFAGSETRGQLDFATLFFAKARPGVLARGMLAMFAYDESSSIGNIAVPVLVVHGDRDPVLLPRAGEHIAAVIPGGTFASLADAKHMGLIEHYAHFDAIVRAFVDAHLAVRTRT
ncbi:MAG: alpha/beta hydrolase [Candidatus Velthaea sp.]